MCGSSGTAECLQAITPTAPDAIEVQLPVTPLETGNGFAKFRLSQPCVGCPNKGPRIVTLYTSKGTISDCQSS